MEMETTITSTKETTTQNLREQLFQKRLSELRTFHTLHGHGSIPTPYPPNPSLGVWAANLRRQFALRQRAEVEALLKVDDDDDTTAVTTSTTTSTTTAANYSGYLTSSRQDQLLKVGFDFSSLTERQFQMRLEELQVFKGRYGHCMVPEKWEENLALGAWVSNIRSLYKRKRTMEREDQLLKVEKNGKHKKRQTRKKLLQSSQEERGNRSPRFSHLDDQRIQLLEDMGFVWSSTDRKWLEMLEWAKVYGVVRYEMTKLALPGGGGVEEDDVNGSDDDSVSLMDDGDNGDAVAIQLEQNGISEQHDNPKDHTLLLANYQHFVHNIQDEQSLLPSFHPQDEILTLLLNETYAQNDLLGQEKHQPPVEHHFFQASSLDYRISPNDTLNQPLRIWMINQRSNYNRLHHNNNSNHTQEEGSMIPSTMTPQRHQSLEEIHFPWSGRFPNRISEVDHENEQLAEVERQREKDRKIEEKERKERDMVEQLTSSIVASVSNDARSVAVGGGSGGEGGGGVAVVVEEEEVDIMSLWDAEDDDDW